MRIGYRYLLFDSHTNTIRLLREILDRHKITYEYTEDPDCVIPTFKFTLEIYLYEDLPDFKVVKNELDKFNLEPQAGTYYDKADIAKAEWFIINTGEYQYPQPEDGYKEATFNLDEYCRLCGIGKVQNAPFRLKTEPKQKNNQFWGLHWEFEPIFVRQEARNILEKEQIKGISFSNPVFHKKSRMIEGFYQVHINTILNGGFDNYNARTITCKIKNEEGLNDNPELKCCGRVKYHHPKIGGYVFDKAVFNPEFDIVQSSEIFGSGASAGRLQIVSKRFKQLVEKNKLKGLSFKPIVHERLKRY